MVALLSVSALFFALQNQHQRLLENQYWVEHTFSAQDGLNKLLQTAIDGSNGMRGYLLSGKADYLPPFRTMLDTLLPQHARLLELTSDNPAQQKKLAELKPVLEQRLRESRLHYELYAQSPTKAIARIASGQGLQINQALRKAIDELIQEEQRLLAAREKKLTDSYRQTFYFDVGVLALLALLSVFFIRTMSRELIVRDRYSEQLNRLNSELETNNQNLKLANEAIQKSDRLKTNFLSAMSHELRTPLNSIIGFTGVLRMGIPGPLNEEQQKQLGMINDSAQHLLHLINDLLDLSRIESGRDELSVESFDLAEVVAETFRVVSPLASRKSLRLRADCSTGAVRLTTDRRKVFQILLNLVNNAVKFSEHGDVVVSCTPSAHTVQITVSDQGIGIRPENVGMLFQAFQQVDGSARRVYEGAGLGLYLCRKLVEVLGGDISVDSEYGKGSNFRFILPLPPAEG